MTSLAQNDISLEPFGLGVRFDFTSGTQDRSSTTEIHYWTKEQKQFKQNTSGTGLDVRFSVSEHGFGIHSVYRLIRRPSFYSRTI